MKNKYSVGLNLILVTSLFLGACTSQNAQVMPVQNLVTQNTQSNTLQSKTNLLATYPQFKVINAQGNAQTQVAQTQNNSNLPSNKPTQSFKIQDISRAWLNAGSTLGTNYGDTIAIGVAIKPDTTSQLKITITGDTCGVGWFASWTLDPFYSPPEGDSIFWNTTVSNISSLKNGVWNLNIKDLVGNSPEINMSITVDNGPTGVCGTYPSPTPSPTTTDNPPPPSPTPSPTPVPCKGNPKNCATPTPTPSPSPSASPSPTPTPSPSGGGGNEENCESNPILTPQSLGLVVNETQTLSNLLSALPDRLTKWQNVLSSQDQIQAQLVQEQSKPHPNANTIDRLNNQLQNQEQITLQEVAQIQASLLNSNNQRNILRQQLNNTIRNSQFSQDKILNPSAIPQTLEAYRTLFDIIENKFDSAFFVDNTYDLLEAINSFADEQELFNYLIQDYLSRKFPFTDSTSNAISANELLENLNSPQDIVQFIVTNLTLRGDELRKKIEQLNNNFNVDLTQIETSLSQNEISWQMWLKTYSDIINSNDFSTQGLSFNNSFRILNVIDPGEERLSGFASANERLAAEARVGLSKTSNALERISSRLDTINPRIESLKLKQQKGNLSGAEKLELKNLHNEKSQLTQQQNRLQKAQDAGQKVLNQTIKDSQAIDRAKVPNSSCHKYSGKTVADILKEKLGSIKNAPLPKGTPGWDQISKMTWEEVNKLAQTDRGFKEIRKLLTDNRFIKK